MPDVISGISVGIMHLPQGKNIDLSVFELPPIILQILFLCVSVSEFISTVLNGPVWAV